MDIDIKKWFNDTIKYCLSTYGCDLTCERYGMCDDLHKVPGYRMIRRKIGWGEKENERGLREYSANFEDQPENVQCLIRKLYLIKLVSE